MEILVDSESGMVFSLLSINLFFILFALEFKKIEEFTSLSVICEALTFFYSCCSSNWLFMNLLSFFIKK